MNKPPRNPSWALWEAELLSRPRIALYVRTLRVLDYRMARQRDGGGS